MSKLDSLASILTTLCSGSNVFAYKKPKDDNTCVIYRQISSVPIHGMSGSMLEKTRIQIDIWGTTLTQVISTGSVIKNGIDCNQSNFTLGYLITDYPVLDLETGLWRNILEFYIF